MVGDNFKKRDAADISHSNANGIYVGQRDVAVYAFRIKAALDRGSQIYDISLANLAMTNVALPLLIVVPVP